MNSTFNLMRLKSLNKLSKPGLKNQDESILTSVVSERVLKKVELIILELECYQKIALHYKKGFLLMFLCFMLSLAGNIVNFFI